MNKDIEETCVEALEEFYLLSLLQYGIDALNPKLLEAFAETLEETSEQLSIWIATYAMGAGHSFESLEESDEGSPQKVYEKLAEKYREN